MSKGQGFGCMVSGIQACCKRLRATSASGGIRGMEGIVGAWDEEDLPRPGESLRLNVNDCEAGLLLGL